MQFPLLNSQPSALNEGQIAFLTLSFGIQFPSLADIKLIKHLCLKIAESTPVIPPKQS